jgi:hypothetical protein
VKRIILLTATLSALIILALTPSCFVKYTSANPYGWEDIEVFNLLAYPSITILSPTENNTLFNTNNLTVAFKASIESGSAYVPYPIDKQVDFQAYVREEYYKTSWQPNDTEVSSWDYSNPWSPTYFINLTGVPDGNQTVTITVYGHGNFPGTVPIHQTYPWDPSTEEVCYFFESHTHYTLGFTMDTTPPQISVLELNNKTFSTPEVPLSFTVNEAVSKVTYCLDGQDNVTITGNTTLTGLATGDHRLTVYAVDAAGNVGSSETINFYVAPFPTTLVIASVTTVAVIGVGLLVYFKKRKH